MPSAQFDPTVTGSQGQAIGNLITRLLSEYTGRGPTKARTHFNENLITIVVQDLMTKGERSLIRDGKQELVLETRRAYQQTIGTDLTAGIEEITGRQVIAFLSANHLDPDLAVETFVLAPENDGRPPPVQGTPDRTQINDDPSLI
ncbi:MAG: hypothetical protein V7607_1863 [Solirubrobacteraceae bacterium]